MRIIYSIAVVSAAVFLFVGCGFLFLDTETEIADVFTMDVVVEAAESTVSLNKDPRVEWVIITVNTAGDDSLLVNNENESIPYAELTPNGQTYAGNVTSTQYGEWDMYAFAGQGSPDPTAADHEILYSGLRRVHFGSDESVMVGIKQLIDDENNNDETGDNGIEDTENVRFPSLSSGEQTFTVDSIPENADVYFVFSNPTLSDANRLSVSSASATSGSVFSAQLQSFNVTYGPAPEPRFQPVSGTPEITAENQRLAQQVAESPQFSRYGEPVSPQFTTKHPTTIGGGFVFKDYEGTEIPVTLRANTDMIATPQGERALRIWVADDSWHVDGTKANLVTEEMVEIFRDLFLQEGEDNDIFEWLTNIFGPEWGAHGYSNLIDFTGYIDIVMFDIDNDDSTEGGVLGYFDAGNNFTKNDYPISNEMVMFALDSVLLATPDENTSWSVDDFWPNIMVSTLAHEFQHMIHWYNYLDREQNSIALNELLSMSAEDIVADKIKADGPRGVAYNDYTAGSKDNRFGRLPLYNLYNDEPVSTWRAMDDPDVVRSYSVNYAFGAYLMRNYGGPAFLRAIYNSEHIDMAAIEDAVQTVSGYNTRTIGDVFRQWGAAVLLSDSTDAPEYMRYNYGGEQSFAFNDTTYSLGSINLYNYRIDLDSSTWYAGPWVYTGELTDETLSLTSNLYYLAAEDVTGGSYSWTVDVPEGIELTVVIKQ